jgi:hypothetical protein
MYMYIDFVCQWARRLWADDRGSMNFSLENFVETYFFSCISKTNHHPYHPLFETMKYAVSITSLFLPHLYCDHYQRFGLQAASTNRRIVSPTSNSTSTCTVRYFAIAYTMFHDLHFLLRVLSSTPWRWPRSLSRSYYGKLWKLW